MAAHRYQNMFWSCLHGYTQVPEHVLILPITHYPAGRSLSLSLSLPLSLFCLYLLARLLARSLARTLSLPVSHFLVTLLLSLFHSHFLSRFPSPCRFCSLSVSLSIFLSLTHTNYIHIHIHIHISIHSSARKLLYSFARALSHTYTHALQHTQHAHTGRGTRDSVWERICVCARVSCVSPVQKRHAHSVCKKYTQTMCVRSLSLSLSLSLFLSPRVQTSFRHKISDITWWQKCFPQLKMSNPKISCSVKGERGTFWIVDCSDLMRLWGGYH